MVCGLARSSSCAHFKERLKLREENEGLQTKLAEVREKYNRLAADKAHLSAKLIDRCVCVVPLLSPPCCSHPRLLAARKSA